MAEAYSAGTIFLQVVPVFRQAQEKVTAYAKGISNAMGDELDKGGKDAGERFNEGFEKEVKKGAKKAAEEHTHEFQRQYDRAVQNMQKNLRTIEPKFENNDARRQIRELKADLDTLTDKKIKTEADVRQAVANIRILEAQLGGLPEVVSTRAKFEAAQAYKDASKFVAFVESIDGKDVEIEIKADTKDLIRAERAMGVFEKRLRDTARKAANDLGDPIDRRVKQIKAELLGLANTDIHIGLNDDIAKRKINELTAELYRLSSNDVNIATKADTGAAYVKLFALKKLHDKLDGDDINMDVNVRSGGAEAKIAALTGTTAGSANAFRAFNFVVLAAVAFIPLLIPLVGALGGALLALMPILAGLGGGLAAVVIGFTGIANAVQALNARSQSSAKDTLQQTKTIRDAWYAVADARRAVGDAERSAAQQAADSARAVAEARRSAAESVRAALESQRQAQRAYKDSVDEVRDAEQALRDAREQAKVDRHSLADQIKDNRLAIRQGVLGAFDATNNLNAVMADGSSTAYDKEQAKIQRAQALQSLHELRDEQKRLAAEQKKQRKEGIDGTDEVKSAQDQLTQAIQAQQDATENLGKASRAVDQARADGARRVADAVRSQQRAQADGARAVARAQENLRRAQENYNDALSKTNDIGSSSQDQVRQAMAVLGPAGRQFARFIFSLRKGFYQLRNDIQAAMLPPLQDAIEQIIRTVGPQMHDFLVSMAGEFGDFAKRFANSLGGKAWSGFFDMLDRLGPRFMRQFGKGVILWLETFAQLMVIVAPWAVKLSDAMLAIAEGVNKWIMSKEGTKVIQDFMTYAAQSGPELIAFLEAFVGAVLNLGKALAPWAETVLKMLTGFLDWIADMDPKLLGLIVTTMIALVIAFQLGVGAVAVATSALLLLSSTFGVIIFVAVLAAAMVITLASRFKTFRKVIEFVVKAFVLYMTFGLQILWFLGKWLVHNETLRKILSTSWNFLKRLATVVFNAISDAIGWIVDAAQDAWRFLKPIFVAIGDIVEWLWRNIVKPYIGLVIGTFRFLGRVIRAVWRGFIWPVLDLFIHIFTKLATKVIFPFLSQIVTRFQGMGRLVRQVWRGVLKPVFDAFGKAANWLWDHVLKPIFHAIGDIWEIEMKGLRKIYDKWVKPMIDAFIDLLGGPQGLKSKFKAVVGAIKDIWNGLKKIFAAPIKFVLDTVINHGVIAGFNKIAKFVGSTPMKEIPIPDAIDNAYARGGVMPGYFPGGDNHHFVSPTGGRLHLSGGEAIMRPEWTQAMGPNFIESMNAVAARQGARGVRKLMQGAAGHFFSEGGIFGGTHFAKGGALRNPDQKVYMDGKAIAAIAAAQILLAEQLKHTNYYLMQGGFGGDHIAASGSSHNYPGVADISTRSGVTFADQAVLRRVAFAAWARNIPGAAYVGSGEHVHAASLLSPGTKGSPQVYGSWPGHTDGLAGGNDYGPRPSLLPDLAARLGSFDLSNVDPGGKGHHGFGLPGWLLDIARNPIGYVGGLVTKPVKTMYDKFGHSDFLEQVAGVPMHLVKGVAHKVLDIIPGGGAIARAAGFAFDKINDVGHWVDNATENVAGAIGHVGDVLGFSRGGILPYNGTMMYDAGGYLPTGLTSVVNLTGKPEPVLTSDQFERVSDGMGGFTYAPTFYDAHGTEEIMEDLEFAVRKQGRQGSNGRYGRRG